MPCVLPNPRSTARTAPGSVSTNVQRQAGHVARRRQHERVDVVDAQAVASRRCSGKPGRSSGCTGVRRSMSAPMLSRNTDDSAWPATWANDGYCAGPFGADAGRRTGPPPARRCASRPDAAPATAARSAGPSRPCSSRRRCGPRETRTGWPSTPSGVRATSRVGWPRRRSRCHGRSDGSPWKKDTACPDV